ncbi:ATPase, AAA family [Teladorsagia circumcincta]|uniref:ATPase, AAA family n=1 Tax=Teladorsagia circumcincta TaxID=45464 RepID=A0A2G9V3V0_TELCI|nr:ATPase, AAA family [Teladorsagia circumcincta]
MYGTLPQALQRVYLLDDIKQFDQQTKKRYLIPERNLNQTKRKYQYNQLQQEAGGSELSHDAICATVTTSANYALGANGHVAKSADHDSSHQFKSRTNRMMEVDMPLPPAVINLPWVEKYRPESLTDMISHEEIIKTLTRFVKSDRLPHLLFYGPPGTGKTSAILAVVNTMYSDKQRKSMVLELNASDDRGIGIVRDEIITFAQTKSLQRDKETTDLKFVILDEADAMTKDAQNALRRVIEKYTSNVRFCIICNYLSSIIPAIQSRCTRFRFAPLSVDHILPKLNYVIAEEKLTVTEDGKQALLKLSGGDMRRVLNVLQVMICLISALADTEQRLAVGASDRIQIGGLVGAFVQARRMIKEAAKS